MNEKITKPVASDTITPRVKREDDPKFPLKRRIDWIESVLRIDPVKFTPLAKTMAFGHEEEIREYLEKEQKEQNDELG